MATFENTLSARHMHARNAITVLIAVEPGLFREGLHLFLAEQEDLEVVGEATEAVQILHAMEALRPEILMLDIQMPAVGALEMLAPIQALSPRTKVLLLAVRLEDDLLSEALEKGAHGYLPKAATHRELLRAIRALAAGELWAPRTLLTRVVERLRQRVETLRGFPPTARELLTAREWEVVQGVIQGLANREIATRLGIREKTVKTHLSNVFRKLNIRRRIDLLRIELTGSVANFER
jgi:DNA-binding NarL/FixJ family response regulator